MFLFDIHLGTRACISGYWSLAGYAERKVKSAVGFIYDFEDSVMRAVRDRGLDGVRSRRLARRSAARSGQRGEKILNQAKLGVITSS